MKIILLTILLTKYMLRYMTIGTAGSSFGGGRKLKDCR